MKISDFESIVNQLFDLGCLWFVITGGEPSLLGEKLYDYIKIVKSKKNTKVVLTTNGILPLKKNISPELVDILQISIDGNEFIHDYIRGKGNYKKTINFLEKHFKKFKMTIMMTLHNDNYMYLQEVHELSKKYNVNFGVEIMSPCGRGKLLKVLNDSQLVDVFSYLKENNISCSDPRFLVYSYYKTINSKYFKFLLTGCSAGISTISFDCFGNVYPCARTRIKLGNLTEKTLISIWNESSLLDTIRKRKYSGKCKNCKFLSVCASCRANQNNIFIDGEKECWLYESENKL